MVGRERRKEGRVDVATALSHSTLAAAIYLGQSILSPYLFSLDVGHSIHPLFEDLSRPL